LSAGRWAGALSGEAGVRWGTGAVAAIVLLCLVVVLMAADRPSLLSPTTHIGFYPRWMAGPLGGLWPSLTGDSTTLRYLFTAAIGVMYVGYLMALRVAPRLPARFVIGAILVVHAIFLLAPPMALTDVFNYINYGRMEVVHNLNPYTTIPITEPHSDPAFILSNWHELLSPYGPTFTLLTFVVVPLGVAGSFWALKVILMGASLAVIYLVWRCALLLGRNPLSAIVLVGLNPIVLVWGLGGDHNDFLVLLCMMLGFYLLLRARERDRADAPDERGRAAREHARGATDARGDTEARGATEERGASEEGGRAGRGLELGRVREWVVPLAGLEMGAGAAFVLATATKASAGILIPVVLVSLLRSPRALTQFLFGVIIAGVIVGAVSLVAFGLHIPDLSTQSRLVTGESVPNLVGLVVGAGGESEGVRFAMSAALGISVILCCVLAWRGRGAFTDRGITASGWASVALLVTLSWVLPWYVLWVLPLAAVSSSRRLKGAALVLGVYLIVAWAPASGLLWSAIGFHPEKTPLGRLHQRYVRELLN
jgi:hypothetical protein